MLPVFLRKELLCSNDNLYIAINEATPFCQIQGSYVILSHVYFTKIILCIFAGFVVHVFTILYGSLWLLFVFHLFARIVDANGSWIVNDRQHTGKMHVIEVTTVLFLALIVPIITVTALDGYNISYFPAFWCFPSTEILFHSVILPCIVVTVIGLSLILITFLKIHRVSLLYIILVNVRTYPIMQESVANHSGSYLAVWPQLMHRWLFRFIYSR